MEKKRRLHAWENHVNELEQCGYLHFAERAFDNSELVGRMLIVVHILFLSKVTTVSATDFKVYLEAAAWLQSHILKYAWSL